MTQKPLKGHFISDFQHFTSNFGTIALAESPLLPLCFGYGFGWRPMSGFSDVFKNLSVQRAYSTETSPAFYFRNTLFILWAILDSMRRYKNHHLHDKTVARSDPLRPVEFVIYSVRCSFISQTKPGCAYSFTSTEPFERLFKAMLEYPQMLKLLRQLINLNRCCQTLMQPAHNVAVFCASRVESASRMFL